MQLVIRGAQIGVGLRRNGGFNAVALAERPDDADDAARRFVADIRAHKPRIKDIGAKSSGRVAVIQAFANKMSQSFDCL